MSEGNVLLVNIYSRFGGAQKIEIPNLLCVLVIEYWNLRFVCNLVLGVCNFITPCSMSMLHANFLTPDTWILYL